MTDKKLSGWLIASDIDGTLNDKHRKLPILMRFRNLFMITADTLSFRRADLLNQCESTSISFVLTADMLFLSMVPAYMITAMKRFFG